MSRAVSCSVHVGLLRYVSVAVVRLGRREGAPTDGCALVGGGVFADLHLELFDNLFGVVDDFVGFFALCF